MSHDRCMHNMVSSQFDRRLFRPRVHSIETKRQLDGSKGFHGSVSEDKNWDSILDYSLFFHPRQAKYFLTDLIDSKVQYWLIELTLVFDWINFYQSDRPPIETTFDRTDWHSTNITSSLWVKTKWHSFIVRMNWSGLKIIQSSSNAQ